MKYLGIDFGLKRVGLATSEGALASPWKVITGNNFLEILDKIYAQAAAFEKVVIGLPEGNLGKRVKKAVQILTSRGIKVDLTDETLSSYQASKLMIELNIPKRKRTVTDAQAAAIILQNYLDSQ